jgi:hypothetical protein
MREVKLAKGGDDMQCPLRLKSQKRPLGEATFGVPEFVEDFDICIKENCSWWDDNKKSCVMSHLGSIQESLAALAASKKT